MLSRFALKLILAASSDTAASLNETSSCGGPVKNGERANSEAVRFT
jgi:hypothetical protein